MELEWVTFDDGLVLTLKILRVHAHGMHTKNLAVCIAESSSRIPSGGHSVCDRPPEGHDAGSLGLLQVTASRRSAVLCANVGFLSFGRSASGEQLLADVVSAFCLPLRKCPITFQRRPTLHQPPPPLTHTRLRTHSGSHHRHVWLIEAGDVRPLFSCLFTSTHTPAETPSSYLAYFPKTRWF